MASNPLNFKKNHADVVAAESALAPILKAANIVTIQVDGKDVSASDAPLAAKITTLGKLIATGDKTEDSAAAIQANGELAAQLEVLEGKLTAANSTISAQTQKINDLSGKLTVATDSVNTLTNRNTELGTLLKASTDESIRLTGVVNTQKTEMAQKCIRYQCVDLKDAAGKDIAKDAAAEVKLEAAMKFSYADLCRFADGAVNAAIAKTGANPLDVPTATGNTQPAKTELTGRARFIAAAKAGNATK